jgi:hypothetical protein
MLSSVTRAHLLRSACLSSSLFIRATYTPPMQHAPRNMQPTRRIIKHTRLRPRRCDSMQQARYNMQQTPCMVRATTYMPCTTCNMQQKACNRKNQEATCAFERCTARAVEGLPRHALRCSCTLHVASCMLHVARCTLHVARCMLHVCGQSTSSMKDDRRSLGDVTCICPNKRHDRAS